MEESDDAERIQARRLLLQLVRPHDISDDERDFITTSRRRRRRRTAAWRTVLAVIVILCMVAGFFAVNLQQRSTELQHQLRQNATHALLAQARERLSSEPDTAALLTVAAHRANASRLD